MEFVPGQQGASVAAPQEPDPGVAVHRPCHQEWLYVAEFPAGRPPRVSGRLSEQTRGPHRAGVHRTGPCRAPSGDDGTDRQRVAERTWSRVISLTRPARCLAKTAYPAGPDVPRNQRTRSAEEVRRVEPRYARQRSLASIQRNQAAGGPGARHRDVEQIRRPELQWKWSWPVTGVPLPRKPNSHRISDESVFPPLDRVPSSPARRRVAHH